MHFSPKEFLYMCICAPLLTLKKNNAASYFEFDHKQWPWPVITFVMFLQGKYSSVTSQRMRALRISALDLVTQVKYGLEHECVMATVVDDKHSLQQFVCFERLPKSACEYPRRQPSLMDLGVYNKAGQFHDSMEFADRILRSPRDRVLTHLSLPTDSEAPLYLYQLVVLANALHNIGDSYILFTVDHSWYAGMLLNLVGHERKLEPEMIEPGHQTWQSRLFQPVDGQALAAPMERLLPVLTRYYLDLEKFESTIISRQRQKIMNEKLKEECQKLRENIKQCQDEIRQLNEKKTSKM
ncbi:hypothetical protein GALMADRAFT_154577 [Galerina marginata CBS 339.88]|uniref:Uncharacterized protein n=1 Tax=Galerina marginata (strain CBS 339.88) TaxID=685588 RepID=A0A067T5Y8_GALM3|nr:hypothetical protein GALMADRAFT_154577 [Galerina marginata CBS 339.88]